MISSVIVLVSRLDKRQSVLYRVLCFHMHRNWFSFAVPFPCPQFKICRKHSQRVATRRAPKFFWCLVWQNASQCEINFWLGTLRRNLIKYLLRFFCLFCLPAWEVRIIWLGSEWVGLSAVKQCTEFRPPITLEFTLKIYLKTFLKLLNHCD